MCCFHECSPGNLFISDFVALIVTPEEKSKLLQNGTWIEEATFFEKLAAIPEERT